MIIVHFTGGLGNQLAEYGLYSEYKSRGLKTYADTSWFRSYETGDGKVDGRKLELPLLGIKLDECPSMYGYYGKETGFNRYMRRILVGPCHFEKDYRFTPELLDVTRGQVLGGAFLGEQYMPSCGTAVRDSINFSGTDTEYIREMTARIEGCNAVSVHMRLGDYLNNTGLYGGICTADYYRKAVELITKVVKDPTFFIFSNNVGEAVKMLGIDGAVPVTGNTGDKSYLDMYLMSRCRHNIIANSTFSWWGAWLNDNDEKRVICPTTLLNGYDNGSVYCKDWIRVSS